MARDLYRAALEASDAAVQSAVEEEALLAAEEASFHAPQLPMPSVLPKDRRFLPVPGSFSEENYSESNEGSSDVVSVEVKRSAPRLSSRKWSPPPPPEADNLNAAPASWIARRRCIQVSLGDAYR